MAAPAPEAELTRSATTIDSLPDEVLTEVLLRVPTPAALVHAAAASKSWRGAITAPGFLAGYRERHKSSPFLGLYVPRQLAGPPSFLMPDSIRLAGDGARDLKDAAVRAFDFGETRRYQDHRLHDAFILGRLGLHPDCRLLDCHNSRLLLTRGDEGLEVRSPLARESILVPFPPGVVDPQCVEACLLQGHDEAASSFQVVYLQRRRKDHGSRHWQARAVEYSSSRKSWQDHPWQTLKSEIEGKPKRVMHAGHRMFSIYKGPTQAALMLDTRKMEVSILPLPAHANFAIGEIQDNACCLVESVVDEDNHRLKVWQLDEAKLDWELKTDIEMDQVLGDHVRYYRPRAVSNGIALLCSTTKHYHFVVDLNTCSMKDKFEFHGESAYLMQMPWPPTFSARTANVMNPASSEDGSNENLHELRDGPADGAWLSREPLYPSNEPQYLDIQDPTTTASPAVAEQCFGKDKNYVPSDDYLIPDLCGEFSDLMHPEGSHNPERRSLIRLEQGATCHPKYCIKDPEITMHGEFFVTFNKKFSSFALFESKVSAECSPYQTSLKYNGSIHDKEVLTQMRTWLAYNPLGLKDLELQLRSLKSDSTCDLVCKVVHVHEDSGKWIFYVWDGTDTPAAEFQAISDDEAFQSPPLHEGPPLPREVLCTMPCVGTVLRIVSNRFIKEVLHMKKGMYWARFCNITCKQEFGIWKGILQPSSRVRLLSHEDGGVVDRQKMYDSRSANKVQRQPMASFPSNVTGIEHEKAGYTTLMESLTHDEVVHKFKTLVRVVGALPCRPSGVRLLSTGKYCMRLTLEDPTARINAYVHKDDMVKFFGGFLTEEAVIKKMNKLLGNPEPEENVEGAPLTRNPPWIWCCMFSFYKDEADPWGSRTYRIYDTEIRD